MIVCFTPRSKFNNLIGKCPASVKINLTQQMQTMLGLSAEELKYQLLKLVLTPPEKKPMEALLNETEAEIVMKIDPEFNIKVANELRSARVSNVDKNFMAIPRHPYDNDDEYQKFLKCFKNDIIKGGIAEIVFAHCSELKESDFESFMYLTSQSEEKSVYGGLRKAGFPRQYAELLWPYAKQFNKFVLEARKAWPNINVATAQSLNVIQTSTTNVTTSLPDTSKDVAESTTTIQNDNSQKEVQSLECTNEPIQNSSTLSVATPAQNRSTAITPRVILENDRIFREFDECWIQVDTINKKNIESMEFEFSDFSSLYEAFSNLHRAMEELVSHGFTESEVWKKRYAINSLFASCKKF